jgi:hypothetical protein
MKIPAFLLAFAAAGGILSAQSTSSAADFFGGVYGNPGDPVQVVSMQARLTTIQENPVVTTETATGLGTVDIRFEKPAAGPARTFVLVTIDLGTQQASTIRLAHIHRGPVGTNGPIVLDFDIPGNGGNIPTTAGGSAKFIRQFEVTSAATLSAINEIVANPAGFYFNVHSVANPGGVVRGQLIETDLSSVRRLEKSNGGDLSVLRRLTILQAARDGVITVEERDRLLAGGK